MYERNKLLEDLKGVPLEERGEIYEKHFDKETIKRFKEFYPYAQKAKRIGNKTSEIPGWLEVNRIDLPIFGLPYYIIHQASSYFATGEVINPSQDGDGNIKRFSPTTKNSNQRNFGSLLDKTFRKNGFTSKGSRFNEH